LIQLTELVPLGDSGVKYGYQARLGSLERLVEIEVKTISDDAVLLRTYWGAVGGDDILEWETPLYSRSLLTELISYLERFLPTNAGNLAIQRSKIPLPDNLAQLRDPSSNDPSMVRGTHQRFWEALTHQLTENEKVRTWALWPAWFENKNYPQVLVVTDQRILSLKDPLL